MVLGPVASAVARLVAAVLAVASLAPVWIGLALAWPSIAVSAQRPDPSVPDGDPCCGYPDTWGEVATGIAWGLACSAVAVALLYVTITLAQYAIKRERPKLLRLPRLIASFATAVVVSAAFTALVFVAG